MAKDGYVDQSGVVKLNDEPAVVDLVTSSVFKLWEAVNQLTRLRPTRSDRFCVTIFGSARVPKDHWVYAAVRDLAAELTRMDCEIVSGGGARPTQAGQA